MATDLLYIDSRSDLLEMVVMEFFASVTVKFSLLVSINRARLHKVLSDDLTQSLMMSNIIGLIHVNSPSLAIWWSTHDSIDPTFTSLKALLIISDWVDEWRIFPLQSYKDLFSGWQCFCGYKPLHKSLLKEPVWEYQSTCSMLRRNRMQLFW